MIRSLSGQSTTDECRRLLYGLVITLAVSGILAAFAALEHTSGQPPLIWLLGSGNVALLGVALLGPERGRRTNWLIFVCISTIVLSGGGFLLLA